MHCQWQGLNTTVSKFEPSAQIVVFDSSKDASWRPLYWRYTGDSEQCYNSMLFSRKVKMELQRNGAMADCVHVFEIINLTVLAEWNCVKK